MLSFEKRFRQKNGDLVFEYCGLWTKIDYKLYIKVWRLEREN
jgi:hypothetical protein